MRLIDADALKEKCPSNLGAPLWLIDEMPTIEPKRGKWIPHDFESYIPIHENANGGVDIHKYTGYTCSLCGYKVGTKQSNYCPNCGAKMDERREDETD